MVNERREAFQRSFVLKWKQNGRRRIRNLFIGMFTNRRESWRKKRIKKVMTTSECGNHIWLKVENNCCCFMRKYMLAGSEFIRYATLSHKSLPIEKSVKQWNDFANFFHQTFLLLPKEAKKRAETPKRNMLLYTLCLDCEGKQINISMVEWYNLRNKISLLWWYERFRGH